MGWTENIYCEPKYHTNRYDPWWAVRLDTGFKGGAAYDQQREAYHEYDIDAESEGRFTMYFGAVVDAGMSASSPRTRPAVSQFEDGLAAERVNWVIRS